MSWSDVMGGPLGQVNNMFQGNLAANAALTNQGAYYGFQQQADQAAQQAQYNNIFSNFGQQTDYYSMLGAQYGRATGYYGDTGAAQPDYSSWSAQPAQPDYSAWYTQQAAVPAQPDYSSWYTQQPAQPDYSSWSMPQAPAADPYAGFNWGVPDYGSYSGFDASAYAQPAQPDYSSWYTPQAVQPDYSAWYTAQAAVPAQSGYTSWDQNYSSYFDPSIYGSLGYGVPAAANYSAWGAPQTYDTSQMGTPYQLGDSSWYPQQTAAADPWAGYSYGGGYGGTPNWDQQTAAAADPWAAYAAAFQSYGQPGVGGGFYGSLDPSSFSQSNWYDPGGTWGASLGAGAYGGVPNWDQQAQQQPDYSAYYNNLLAGQGGGWGGGSYFDPSTYGGYGGAPAAATSWDAWGGQTPDYGSGYGGQPYNSQFPNYGGQFADPGSALTNWASSFGQPSAAPTFPDQWGGQQPGDWFTTVANNAAWDPWGAYTNPYGSTPAQAYPTGDASWYPQQAAPSWDAWGAQTPNYGAGWGGQPYNSQFPNAGYPSSYASPFSPQASALTMQQMFGYDPNAAIQSSGASGDPWGAYGGYGAGVGGGFDPFSGTTSWDSYGQLGAGAGSASGMLPWYANPSIYDSVGANPSFVQPDYSGFYNSMMGGYAGMGGAGNYFDPSTFAPMMNQGGVDPASGQSLWGGAAAQPDYSSFYNAVGFPQQDPGNAAALSGGFMLNGAMYGGAPANTQFPTSPANDYSTFQGAPTSWTTMPDNLTPDRFAAARNNNPGAMYPGSIADMYGATGQQSLLGGQYKIASFDTPIAGAAAAFQNLSQNYTGMSIGAAISKWSGGLRGTIPGYDSSTIITPAMVQDPNFAIPFVKAIAGGESPGNVAMTPQDWQQAHDMFTGTGAFSNNYYYGGLNSGG